MGKMCEREILERRDLTGSGEEDIERQEDREEWMREIEDVRGNRERAKERSD